MSLMSLCPSIIAVDGGYRMTSFLIIIGGNAAKPKCFMHESVLK